MSGIAANLSKVRECIVQAAQKAGRNPAEVSLVAVTKTVAIPKIDQALALGVADLGENKVQELVNKYEAIGPKVKWHLIGHLQTNKVKYIVDKVDLIHSLDRLSLAQEINKRADQLRKKIQVLVQVNVAEEESKFGLRVRDVIPFIREIKDLEGLSIQGLMTMAPFVDDAEEARPVFRALRNLRDEISSMGLTGVQMKYLSMGMTNDFEVAVEEGANLVRVGSGIFGARN